MSFYYKENDCFNDILFKAQYLKLEMKSFNICTFIFLKKSSIEIMLFGVATEVGNDVPEKSGP